MNLIDKAKEVFLDDAVEPEVLADNKRIIEGWASELMQHEAMAGWQSHEVTQMVLEKFNREYVSITMRLGRGKDLTDAGRSELFAKKEAMEFIFTLMSEDAVQNKANLEKEISHKISLFSG